MTKARDLRETRTAGRTRQDRSGVDLDIDDYVDWEASARIEEQLADARRSEEQPAREKQVIDWSSDDEDDGNASSKGVASSPECSISKKLQALRDPPVCFCDRAAYETHNEVFGTIYECHFTNTAVFPTGERFSGMICGFHIHKEVCDQFRHQLQQGVDIDEQDPELSVCPYFNFAACALLGMTNTYEKRTPPVTKCFCRLPMALFEPDTFSDVLTFRCPNVRTPGARPKCSYKVCAEQVPFQRARYLPHFDHMHHIQEKAASDTSLRPDIPTTTASVDDPSFPGIPASAASYTTPNSDDDSDNNSDRSPGPSPTSNPDVSRKQCVPSDQDSALEDEMVNYPHTRQALADLRKDPDVHNQFEGASESLLKKLQDVQREIEAVALSTQDMMKRSSAMSETEADFQRLQLQVDHQHSHLHEQETRTKRAEIAARIVQNDYEHLVQLSQNEDDQRRTVQRDIVQLDIRMSSTLQEHQHLRSLVQERKSMSAFGIKCCICQHRTIEVAIIPCFHSCYCRECVSKLRECAVCRGLILGVQRIYYD